MVLTTKIQGTVVQVESTYLGPWTFEVVCSWKPVNDDDDGQYVYYDDYAQSHMVATDRAIAACEDMIPNV